MGLFGKLFGKGDKKEKLPRMVANQYLEEQNGLFVQPFDFWGDTITVSIDRTDWEEEPSLIRTNQVIDWLNVNQFRIEGYLSDKGKSFDVISTVVVSKEKAVITLGNTESVFLTNEFTLEG